MILLDTFLILLLVGTIIYCLYKKTPTNFGSFENTRIDIPKENPTLNQRPNLSTITTNDEVDSITKHIGVAVEYSGKQPRQLISEVIASLTHEVQICPDCGFEIIPASAKYCWNCGTKLEKPVKNTDENIVISLPLEDYVITALNKIALEEIKAIDEVDFEGQVIIQKFCDVLIENQIASAQLCKKVGALLAKLGEYENAIHYYEVAMDIDPNLDLNAQIERWNKKLYDY